MTKPSTKSNSAAEASEATRSRSRAKTSLRLYPREIHHREARALLRDGQPHRIKVWKKETGEVLLYPRAVYIGGHTNGRTTRVLLLPSGEIRRFINIMLHEIDDMQVFL